MVEYFYSFNNFSTRRVDNISIIWNLISLVLSKQKNKDFYWKESDQCPSKSRFYTRSTGFNILWERELRNSKISQWIDIPVNLIYINNVDSELKQLILMQWYIRNCKFRIVRAVNFCRRYIFYLTSLSRRCLRQTTFFFVFTRIFTST